MGKAIRLLKTITIGNSVRGSLFRLGIALPLTPWPALVHIRNQGMYQWSPGRHSAEALHAVYGPAVWAIAIVHGLAFLLISTSGKPAELRALLYGLIALSWILQWTFVANNSAAYI